MEQKCFCHLNGYAVKDATARADIETLKTGKVSNEELAETMSGVNNHFSQVEQSINDTNTRLDYLPDNATELPFDNTGTGIGATNTRDAIKEVKDIAERVSQGTAQGITYNNVTSGLDANNVQSAIDEVADGLKASDGTPFRFGYDMSTGEYGYLIADSEGADTFHPFSNAKKLYEALQYSGIVTEDMTYDEMCNALSEYFVETLQLILNSNPTSGHTVTHKTDGTSENPNASYYTITSTRDNDKLKLNTEIIAYDNRELSACGIFLITVNKKAFTSMKMNVNVSNFQGTNDLRVQINGETVHLTHLSSDGSLYIPIDISRYDDNSDIVIKLRLETSTGSSTGSHCKCSVEWLDLVLGN